MALFQFDFRTCPVPQMSRLSCQPCQTAVPLCIHNTPFLVFTHPYLLPPLVGCLLPPTTFLGNYKPLRIHGHTPEARLSLFRRHKCFSAMWVLPQNIRSHCGKNTARLGMDRWLTALQTYAIRPVLGASWTRV